MNWILGQLGSVRGLTVQDAPIALIVKTNEKLGLECGWLRRVALCVHMIA